MNNPKIIDNTIIISTINKMNFKEVKEYKNTIQTYISKELNNYSILVEVKLSEEITKKSYICLLYTSPSPRDVEESRMPSSA